MGKFCVAYGCNNNSKECKDKGISLHMFPKDPTLREQWAFAMKRKGFKPTKNSSVCSVHFRPEDFEVDDKSQIRERKRAHLKKNVIPTIFTTGLPIHLQTRLCCWRRTASLCRWRRCRSTRRPRPGILWSDL